MVEIDMVGIDTEYDEWIPNIVRVETLWYGYNIIEELQFFKRVRPKGLNYSTFLQKVEET